MYGCLKLEHYDQPWNKDPKKDPCLKQNHVGSSRIIQTSWLENVYTHVYLCIYIYIHMFPVLSYFPYILL